VPASTDRKPVRRPTRRAGVARADGAVTHEETRAHAEVAHRPVAGAPPPAPPSSGVRVTLEELTVQAEEPRLERNELKAVLSVRRGEQLVYAERVNLDWPGGRDKFLRKATRALGAAGIATRITEACLAELRSGLRARSAVEPTKPSTRARSEPRLA
jgi:hypothetical protein